MISYEELCQKFSACFNYLNYLSVKCKINILLTKFGYAVENIILERPFVPVNLKYILKAKKGVGTVYRIFHANFRNDHKMKSRWNQEFEICIDHDTWRMFSICFKTVTNNNLIWFQLKLIYRILGTNSYLHKLGIRNSLNCRYCQQPESLLHIL